MANLIRQDMADEPPERLESIKEELESVQSATFWELEDRGYNFEYLTQDRKDQLQAFMEIPIDGGEGGSDGEDGGTATETSPATSNPPSRRNRRRMRKGKSSNMLQVSPSSASTIGGQNSGTLQGVRCCSCDRACSYAYLPYVSLLRRPEWWVEGGAG